MPPLLWLGAILTVRPSERICNRQEVTARNFRVSKSGSCPIHLYVLIFEPKTAQSASATSRLARYHFSGFQFF
jgi:hypothetical protein